MMQDYPIGPTLETKLAAESSFNPCHIQGGNYGEISGNVPTCPDFVHPLTMNSVARHGFND
ncbi:MAG: hypothetical protein HY244_16570 [Rhizobiales bacterium]|nr:hypothetical protein [Hyphomicrobiales bacterium]